MKRILFLLLIISSVAKAQTPKYQGPWTPMTGRGYQFKDIKVDSGFNSLKTAHFADSAFLKGYTQLNQTPPLGDSSLRGANTRFVMRAVANVIAGSSGGSCYGLTQAGNVSWVSGLTFFVTAQNYKINCETYESDTTTITLAAADATHPRYDLIAVDTNGLVVVIEGTPSADPVQPLPDPTSQLGLAYVHIAAGATVPTGVFNTVVYDENTEWTGSGDYTGLDFNYATNPLQGTKSTYVSGGSGAKYIRYTNGADLNVSDYATLKFYIRLNTSFSGTTNMTVAFMDNGNPVSSVVILGTAHGFNRALTGAYQVISIPVSAFSFSSTSFDALQFRTTQSVPSFQIDNVFLQTGVTTITNTGVTSFAGRTGAVNPIKADYNAFYMDTVYRLNDSTLRARKGVVTWDIEINGNGSGGGGGGGSGTDSAAYHSVDTVGVLNGFYIQRPNGTQDTIVFSGGSIDTTSADEFTTQTYTTGTSVIVVNSADWLIVNPASLTGFLAITLPASPTDRQILNISFGGTITSGAVVTSLSILANTGQTIIQSSAPGSGDAGETVSYRYNLSTTKWYRL